MGDYLQLLQYALGMVVLALPDDSAATSNTLFGVDKWKAEDMFENLVMVLDDADTGDTLVKLMAQR